MPIAMMCQRTQERDYIMTDFKMPPAIKNGSTRVTLSLQVNVNLPADLAEQFEKVRSDWNKAFDILPGDNSLGKYLIAAGMNSMGADIDLAKYQKVTVQYSRKTLTLSEKADKAAIDLAKLQAQVEAEESTTDSAKQQCIRVL